MSVIDMAASKDETTIKAGCLCGFARYDITIPSSYLPLDAYMCHCASCRKMTGTLALTVVSLPKLFQPSQTLVKRLRPFVHSKYVTQHFCPICGTHLLARCLGDDPDGHVTWDVLTGSLEQAEGVFEVRAHGHISDTLDGGFADLLQIVNGKEVTRYAREIRNSETLHRHWKSPKQPRTTPSKTDKLHAHCKCGGVEFWIARPSERSAHGKAPWPDAIIPFNKPQPPPSEDTAWWIRDNGSKFFAAVCSCNSCRLACGMEWVEWAFVPIIDMTIDREGKVPFSVDSGTLNAYRSSHDATRYFCNTCGATIFWRGDDRPQLIDVAVGILDAPEGARAETWLHWNVKRLSYREDALPRAKGLTLGVEAGLQEYGELRRFSAI